MLVQGFNTAPRELVSEEHIAHSCSEISITENFSTFDSISVTSVGYLKYYSHVVLKKGMYDFMKILEK